MKRTIFLIPNEEKLNIPVFYKEAQLLCHGELLNEFSLEYYYEIKDKYDLINEGHIIISTIDNLIYCELPDQITEAQYFKLEDLRSTIERYPEFIAMIGNEERKMISKINYYEDKPLLDYFYDVIKEEYIKGVSRK